MRKLHKQKKRKETKFNDGVDESAFQQLLATMPTEKQERIVVTSVPLAEMLYLLETEPVGVPTLQIHYQRAFKI